MAHLGGFLSAAVTNGIRSRSDCIGLQRTQARKVTLLQCFCLLAAVAGTPHEVDLRVGESRPFTPGSLPAQVICDDLGVMRVTDAGDHFQLVGLRAGTTLCSFGRATAPGQRVLYRFNVR
jgi:hypothetical protein